MLKLLHKVCFTIVCYLSLLAIPYANSQEEVFPVNQYEKMDLIQQDVKVNDLDIEPIDTKAVKKTVVPDTKQEGKKVMFYFLKVMFGVMLCAIILYVVLLFVKKFYGSAFVNNQDEKYYENFDLATPDNRKDAFKSFLNRTK